MNQEDMDFVRSCMPTKTQMRIVGLVAIAGGLVLLAVGDSETAPMARLLWAGLGALGLLGGVLVIRQSFAGGTHPLLEALARDPSEITGLQVTELDAFGRRSESAKVAPRVGDILALVFCNRKAKRDRLLKILLERAPHLRQTAPARSS